MRERVPLALLLAALTLAAYGGVGALGFVGFDDPGYVAENPLVQRGLTAKGLEYALTTTRLGNWHPATWLSHMAVVELFGSAPAAHHWANVALHLLCTLLLFALLATTTGRSGRSAAVAALFAVHPLHVESVAWVAERKDVLSTAFWLLATLAWVRWTRARTPAAYAAALAATALGLASKSMLVTLPFTWLLLDLWPLRRTALGARRLLLEKAPFFSLAAAFAALAFLVQEREGAVGDLARFSATERAANALRSVATYVGQTVWPADLAVYYPYPASFASAGELLRVAAGAALVGAALVAGVRTRARRPWIACGAWWFLGTLVPVLGLVQIGGQAHADRYTYVPHVGLFVLALWGVAEVLGRARHGPAVGVGLAVAAALACAGATRAQVAVWRDTETLFAHALEVTGPNPVARHFLARGLAAEGRAEEAESHYRAALEHEPGFVEALVGLGALAAERGDLAEAERRLREAARRAPDRPDAWSNLGAVLGRSGRDAAALEALARAVALAPDDAPVRFNLVAAHLARGERAPAVEHLRAALAAQPGAVARRPEALELAAELARDPAATRTDLELARDLGRLFERAAGGGHPAAAEIVARAEERLRAAGP